MDKLEHIDLAAAMSCGARNPVMARVVVVATDLYEGNAMNLRGQGEIVRAWEDADVDDVLACIAAAVSSMRVTSSMLDTSAMLKEQGKAGKAAQS